MQPPADACTPPPYLAHARTEEGAAALPLPLYLLGQDVSGRWTFALDISGARDAFLAFLRDSCELEVAMKDVRVLLPGLSLDACAIAGQAVALSQWHQTHLFCPRCGAPTLPFEAGTRRRCTGPGHHKVGLLEGLVGGWQWPGHVGGRHLLEQPPLELCCPLRLSCARSLALPRLLTP